MAKLANGFAEMDDKLAFGKNFRVYLMNASIQYFSSHKMNEASWGEIR